MPQIKDYTAQNDSLRPTETGIDAIAQGARRVGSFYNQAGEAIKGAAQDKARGAEAFARAQETKDTSYGNIAKSMGTLAIQGEQVAAHQEISHGTANYAQASSDLTQQWNDTVKNADPNNTAIATQFMGEGGKFQQWSDAFLKGFNTPDARDWAEGQVEHLRQHLTEKTSADMSTLAGQAVGTNIAKATSAWTNTARNDPSAVPFLLDSAGKSLDGMIGSNPHLTGTDAGKVRTEWLDRAQKAIAKAGALGAIENSRDPEKAWQVWAERYPQLIDSQEMSTFAKVAKAQAKTNLLQNKQIEVYQRQLDEHKAQGAANKVVSDNVSIDPATNQPITKPGYFQAALDIAKMPNAPPALARTLLDWGQAQQNKENKGVDNPTAVKELNDRLFDPSNPTTVFDLMRAHAKGDISNYTFNTMNGMVKELEQTPLKGPLYEDTMKAVHSALIVSVPGIPGQDTVGTAKYAQFVQAFIPQYLAKSRAGTLEPNALDINDPTSMISKAMAPFKRTVQQRMQDYVTGLQGFGATAPTERVTTKAQFDALSSGQTYTGADGKTYRKP